MKHKLRFFLVLFSLTLAIGPFFVPFSTSGTMTEQDAVLTVPGMNATYFTSLNHSVHYEIRGDEQSDSLIILLHGFGASSFSFQKITEDLSREALVVAYDRAAFGFTERPLDWEGTNPYSFEGQLAVLEDVVRRFGNNKNITLIGHSAGGSLALEYALRNPNKVEALILIAPALSGDRGMPSWVQLLFSLPQVQHLGPILVSTIATSGLQILYDSYFDETKITKTTLNGYTAPLKITNWELGFWEFVTAPRGDLTPIENLRTRTLILTGDNDVIVPTASSIENANRVKAFAELVIMENTGHLPHEEHPRAFVENIIDFLKGNS